MNLERKVITTDQAPAAVGPYSQAIRVGDWKYRKGKKVDGLHGVESPVVEQLFNLKADASESRNLIGQRPEKAAQLAERLRHEKEGLKKTIPKH